jgi:hypothetical protein
METREGAGGAPHPLRRTEIGQRCEGGLQQWSNPAAGWRKPWSLNTQEEKGPAAHAWGKVRWRAVRRRSGNVAAGVPSRRQCGEPQVSGAGVPFRSPARGASRRWCSSPRGGVAVGP